MHSTYHEETGVQIFHNGDYSGDVIIEIPMTTEAKAELTDAGTPNASLTITMPAAPLLALARKAMISDIIEKLEQML